MRVQVSRVDLDGRKIDFRLVREGEELELRAMRDKGVAPASRGGSSRASRKTAKGDRAPTTNLKAAVKKAVASKTKGGRKGRR